MFVFPRNSLKSAGSEESVVTSSPMLMIRAAGFGKRMGIYAVGFEADLEATRDRLWRRFGGWLR